jgi:hypothetical protein
MTEAKPWDEGAEFYDCKNIETLRHESLSECLEEYFDDINTHWRAAVGIDATIEEQIRSCGSLEVVAYTRTVIDVAREARNLAERAAEDMLEVMSEGEYGHEDYEVSKPEDDSVLRLAFEAALVVWLGKVKPWTCDVLARREFDADELVVFAREMWPERFGQVVP